MFEKYLRVILNQFGHFNGSTAPNDPSPITLRYIGIKDVSCKYRQF